MTTMPIITDEMVDRFRRTGTRRASYVIGRAGRLAGSGSRVIPQQGVCPNGTADDGKPCPGPNDPGRCDGGICWIPMR